MFDRGRGSWSTRAEPPAADDAPAFVSGAVPDDWFSTAPDVAVDRDEIVVVGVLAAPALAGADSGAADRAAAERGRIAVFREETRDRRIRIAQQIEHRYQRKVAWGVTCGGTREMFTRHSVPVMTRLRQPERHVLDTLVESGVARSRSEALAWCVRLVGEHAEAWLTELRTALGAVDELRTRDPLS